MSDRSRQENSSLDRQRKLIINVSYKCNNHCIFCSIADRACEHGDFEEQKKRIDQAREEGVRLLDIDGGEPTLYPRLFDLLDYAVESGFERIALTSNGRMLSDKTLAERLASYPLQLLISLHSADESLQDRITGSPGSLRQTLRGIMNARRHFPELAVNSTIIDRNMNELDQLARLLIKLRIRCWNIQYYTPFGLVDPSLAPDPYRFGQIVGDLIESYGERIKIQVINLPFCFLPGYEKYSLQDSHKSVRRMLFVDGREVNLADYLATRRFKNGRCKDCPYDHLCQGFWDFGSSQDNSIIYKKTLLDIIPGYRCSAACRFCAVEDSMQDREMDSEKVKREIDRALAFGPKIIRFGGGEPTERDDLEELIAYAAFREFETISIQTNGYRLADSEYLDSLTLAGLNRIHISIRGADRETHGDLTGDPASFDKLVAAISNVMGSDAGPVLQTDGILTRRNLGDLEREIRFFNKLGSRRFTFWFATPQGRALKNMKEIVPEISEAAESLKRAIAAVADLELEYILCYYIPYCFFQGMEPVVWQPQEENALIVTPDSRFSLDRGSLDIGKKLPICDECALAGLCCGINPSYLEHFSHVKLQPFGSIPKLLK